MSRFERHVEEMIEEYLDQNTNLYDIKKLDRDLRDCKPEELAWDECKKCRGSGITGHLVNSIQEGSREGNPRTITDEDWVADRVRRMPLYCTCIKKFYQTAISIATEHNAKNTPEVPTVG